MLDKLFIPRLCLTLVGGYNLTSITWHLDLQCISCGSNFLVLSYLYITTFEGEICHIIEVLNVHKGWDPRYLGMMELFEVHK